jgi:hypothetical protein
MTLTQNQDVTSSMLLPRCVIPIQSIVKAISAWMTIMKPTSAPITLRTPYAATEGDDFPLGH